MNAKLVVLESRLWTSQAHTFFSTTNLLAARTESTNERAVFKTAGPGEGLYQYLKGGVAYKASETPGMNGMPDTVTLRPVVHARWKSSLVMKGVLDAKMRFK